MMLRRSLTELQLNYRYSLPHSLLLCARSPAAASPQFIRERPGGARTQFAWPSAAAGVLLTRNPQVPPPGLGAR
jgi:hypothetical protein